MVALGIEEAACKHAAKQLRFQRQVEPYDVPATWLFGARTHLMGRFSPQVEQIRLPADQIVGGQLLAEIPQVPIVSSLRERPRRREIPRHLWDTLRKNRLRLPEGRYAIEVRRMAPENWSHSVNHHLLQSLLLRKCIHSTSADAPVTVILPQSIPSYIVALYREFGFETLCTNLPVSGLVGEFWEEPHSCHRAVMAPLCRELTSGAPFAARLFADDTSLPKKVFLSRKDTRKIANEPEIEALLKARGYSKIYPEDLSVAQQFRLFAHATDMVCVHGAGLAPLAYRPVERPGRLVEILSPGHMTDFYRYVAHQVNVDWVGVRGQLWPEVVADAHDFHHPFKRHSLSPFVVDPDSLEAALEHLSSGNP